MKLSNRKIKYIRRQASKKTPEEIAKDLGIGLKDVQSVLKQLEDESRKISIAAPTVSEYDNTAYKYHLIALLAISLLCIVIYSNTLKSPFVFDDDPNIVENKTITNLSNYFSLSKLLKPRAIVDFTFALNYRFGKLNVFGYHLVNILIHILNGLLVYLLVLVILKQRPAFSNSSTLSGSESPEFPIRTISLFAALLFVVHPIQTQAVTYTVQRYASIAALFYMAAVLFYLKARIIQQSAKSRGLIEQKQDAKSAKLKLSSFYVLSILCSMLAFLSKQNAASLPLAILLVEFLLIDHTWRQWKQKLPWFATSFALWALFVLYVSGLFSGGIDASGLLEDVSGLTKETTTVSRWQYLFTQFNVIVIYIRLLFLPVGQNLDYLYPFKNGFFDAYTPLAFLFLIGLFAVGAWRIKKQPVISLAIFWFFITLAVESSIIPIRDAMFEHRLYLPMFGFALIGAYLLFAFFAKQRYRAIIFLVVIIISFGAVTYHRNSVWKDDITLWSDVVSKSPHNYRAHNNLGYNLMAKDRTEEAMAHYSEALRLKPYYADALNNMGLVLYNQDRIEEAIDHYLKALRIKPDFAKVHNNLGLALYKQGRTEEAIDYYLKALRIKPDYANAHNNLGNALLLQDRTEEAFAHYKEALRIQPDFVDAINNMGLALYQQNRAKEAIDHYLQALRINPDYKDAHANLGVALAGQGKLKEAIAHFQEAIRIDPECPDAHHNLGVALRKLGNFEEAIHHLRITLRIKPDYIKAYYNLGVALRDQGHLEEAVVNFKEAVRLKPDYAKAFFNLGVALKDQGHLEEAIVNFKEALQINPDLTESHYQLGVTLVDHGSLDEAKRHFAEVLKAQPDHKYAHNDLGVVLTHQGRLKEALVHFREALRIKPDDATAHGNIGSILAQQGNLKEAIFHFQEALRIKPDFADARDNLQKALAIQKKNDSN